MLRQIHHFFSNDKSGSGQKNLDERNEFYPISLTCQIPKLEEYFLNYFGKTRDGYFVEVGAYDGDTVSNTSGLADVGWNGLYIEPVPSFYEKCKKRHLANGNVKVLNLAISNTDEMLNISIGGVLSTARPDVRDNFVRIGWKKYFDKSETVQITAAPLDLVLENNAIPKGFDLLVIDVEGYEFKVMQSFDVAKWRPKMIIIELHDQNRNYREFRGDSFKISKLLYDSNYQVTFKDMSNTIYVAGNIYDLSEK